MKSRLHKHLPIIGVTFLCAALTLSAQNQSFWRDPSPHTVQFVKVDSDVKLEVLDWGGSGRALVLLAGLGNTAHVFDDFAPKLTADFHVYGITRRGYGASSSPESGYSADQLGDDVLAVIAGLKLQRPVLVGHSIAGEELSSIGTRHPDSVSALIYLDGLNPYSFYSPGAASDIDVPRLQKKLERLEADEPPAEHERLIEELLQDDLPNLEKDLRGSQEFARAAPQNPANGPSPGPDDRASFTAFHNWLKRTTALDFPEADLRATRESASDGSVGKVISNRGSAIYAGEERFSGNIAVPTLAIYANPKEPGPYPYNSPAERAAVIAVQQSGIEQFMKAFGAASPKARVVRLEHANHYVFLSNKTDVLREVRSFLASVD